ncbi:MAG TPA: thiol reductant ABC exporter subunit CydD, partial [Pseudonocardiaceae bacterium]
MKPVDARLLRHAAAARPFIIAAAALGALAAGLVIAQADLLADVLTRAFLGHAVLVSLAVPLVLLSAVVLGRSAVAWLAETAAHRASATVIAQLRATLVDHVLRAGPDATTGRSPAEIATLATTGINGLDGYFARYLPQLLLAVVVPVAVGMRILAADWVAAVVIGLTVPLIPIFMILIGRYTSRTVRRQWRTLSVLANHFVDLVAGLAVLVAFGRARDQAVTIRRITERYRHQTMRTLRVAFLSALTLELLATLSVALVAVSIGLRLVAGHIDLHTALVVLILAPEVYLPLRAVGARFHDSAAGLAAAEDVFAVLDADPRVTGRAPAPDPSRVPVRLADVTVNGRSAPILDHLTLDIPPGLVTGIVGRSGAGKSTVLDLLLAWRRPDGGRVTVGGVDLSDVDREAWLARIAWVPQRPHLVSGTIADNIRLGAPGASADRVRAAAAAAALDLPLDRAVGELGTGLSTGQRRRVALARAVLLDRPLLILDEPTEGVDADTEQAIRAALPAVLAGRTVVIVTHRPAVLDLCHNVITLSTPDERRAAPSSTPPPAAALPARRADDPGSPESIR